MTLPAMHGWTHRPKAQGGTDPIEFPASVMPFAFTIVEDFDMEDETLYTMSASADGGYANLALGCASEIWIGNDDNNGTFQIVNNEDDENQCLGINPDAVGGLFAYDAWMVFSDSFDGVGTIYPDRSFGMWGYPVVAREWRTFTALDQFDAGLRISGVAKIEPPLTDLEGLFSIAVWQISGATRTISHGRMFVTKLSDSEISANQQYPRP